MALTDLSPCRFHANARELSMPAPSPLLLAHPDAVVLVEHTDGSVTLCQCQLRLQRRRNEMKDADADQQADSGAHRKVREGGRRVSD